MEIEKEIVEEIEKEIEKVTSLWKNDPIVTIFGVL